MAFHVPALCLLWLFSCAHGAAFERSLEYAALDRQIRLNAPGLSVSPVVIAPPASAPGAAPSLAESIRWAAHSPDYAAASRHAYALAEQAVGAAARSETKGWVVVLDVDDTVLQTWGYGEELAAAGAPDAPESWRRWVRRGQAAAVPGAREFLEKVRSMGPNAHVAFVSDDEIELQEAKIATLRRLGLFVGGDIILPKTGPEDTKEERRRCLREGAAPRCARYGPLTPLATIGDGIRDHVPVRTRLEAEALRGKIDRGDFWCEARAACILLPNPAYGAWESDYSR